MSGKSSERRGGRALRHFLVIVTQHFEVNRSMAVLVKGYTSAWAVLKLSPAPVWKYLTDVCLGHGQCDPRGALECERGLRSTSPSRAQCTAKDVRFLPTA